MKSLKALHHPLSNSSEQLGLLESDTIDFAQHLDNAGITELKPTSVETLQVNIGKMCNQTCKHCHVDAGPDRKEIMTRETMQVVIDAALKWEVKTVDITGGAPEMNPDFRWFVEQLSGIGCHIIVRCNLTIILANPSYHDLPDFYKSNGVEVVASLPHFSTRRTDAQRGNGVFSKSIEALKMLNAVGYAKDPSLQLNLVYNPTGAFLPPSQASLERDYKTKLFESHGIEFNNLFAITNMPISRFLDYLVSSGNYEKYMDQLVQAFNPAAVDGLMCKTGISISWDGLVYDCDFNQMLEVPLNLDDQEVSAISLQDILNRKIAVANHCFGCTAGAGSSCGGEIA